MPFEGGSLAQEDGFLILQEDGSELLFAPQYLGYEVFDFHPNWETKPSEATERSATVLANTTGLATVKSRSDTPRGFLELTFTLDTRQDLNTLRGFLERVRGRAVPFWIPTWQADFELTADVTTASVLVESVEYAARMFPNNARKHLAFVRHDRAIYGRGVSTAVDNGVTETLTIDSVIPVTILKRASLVSFLLLVRLSTDVVELTYLTPDLVEFTLQCTEVPRETPAP